MDVLHRSSNRRTASVLKKTRRPILSKIDELREIARKTRATVIGITESKLDGSVIDGEINIDG